MCPIERERLLCGIGAGTVQMCPIAPNVFWAIDFQFDQTRDGRTIKILNIIDERTRAALATEVSGSIEADHLSCILDKIAGARGYPAYVRLDHGPELVAHAISGWCRFNGARTIFIDPGSPWQRGWIESFHGRMRDEHLNGQLFDTLFEAQVLTEDWRTDSNKNRLHSAHCWKTPTAFAAEWKNNQQELTERVAQLSGLGHYRAR